MNFKLYERERDHLEESEEEEEREEKRRRWRWRSFGVGANSVMYGLGGLCSFLFLLFYLFCSLLLSLSLSLSHSLTETESEEFGAKKEVTERERDRADEAEKIMRVSEGFRLGKQFAALKRMILSQTLLFISSFFQQTFLFFRICSSCDPINSCMQSSQ